MRALRAPLGMAPLHLLTIGYFAAIVVAMVSRVSLGHSGRPLIADRLTWGCYLGVLSAAALRVAAELVPGGAARSVLMVMAATAWLCCFVIWGWRYLPMYARPRAETR